MISVMARTVELCNAAEIFRNRRKQRKTSPRMVIAPGLQFGTRPRAFFCFW